MTGNIPSNPLNTPGKSLNFSYWFIRLLLFFFCAVLGIGSIFLLKFWPTMGKVNMPGIGLVNTDGFACSVSTAINMADDTQLGDQYPEFSCRNLARQFQMSLSSKSYTGIEDWLIAETNLFLDAQVMPLVLSEIEDADWDAHVQHNISAGVPTIVVVTVQDLVHSIVINGYDNQNGYSYMDQLRFDDDQIGLEQDFLNDYGVQMRDAWLYIFEITKK